MKVLTDKEINALSWGEINSQLSEDMIPFARLVEAAVIKRLAAGVNVEPDGWRTQEYIGAPSQQEPYYNADTFTTAIAAARVTALEEAADPTDDQLVKGVKAMHLFVTNNSVADFKLGYIAAIHALLGKEAQS